MSFCILYACLFSVNLRLGFYVIKKKRLRFSKGWLLFEWKEVFNCKEVLLIALGKKID